MALAAARGLHIIFAPFAAAMMYGGLGPAVAQYREACVKAGKPPGRAKCSYFIDIADTPAEDIRGRQFLLDYFRHCVLRAFPDDPKRMPPRCTIMKITRFAWYDTGDLIRQVYSPGPAATIIETLKG
jgi:hypothetical protein